MIVLTRKDMDKLIKGESIIVKEVKLIIEPKEDKISKLIREAHQEAHSCNALKEVHDWIDWFEKRLRAID